MPKLSLKVKAEAYDEIAEVFDWYAARSEKAAQEFRAALRVAQDSAVNQPEWAEKYLHDTRRISLRRFPHSIIFRQKDDEIVIIAVAHAKRDEAYWENR
ncbi:MAG: type II toxin-antitoxin system RelE/ParE family toxin [Planctomycetia bacterium]|nr:type II toxin-antitoxin system RelE/ParE family toxin [Planctomycetia bacterium]